jgi:hypothetical protein
MKRTLALALMATALPLSSGATSAPARSAGSEFARLEKIGEVDPRFLSYNIEMAEVTGGNFWRPYGSPGNATKAYRPPADLANRKLRQLAAGLAPSYVRYSGTWANATYFEQQGGGVVVPEDSIASLKQEVLDVIFNDWLLNKFRGNLRRMSQENSIDIIVHDLEDLASGIPPARYLRHAPSVI